MKKDFSSTPAAAAFITNAPTPATAAPTVPPAPEVLPTADCESEAIFIYRKKRADKGAETRNRKTVLQLRPSVHATATRYAAAHRVSFNSIIEIALTEYFSNHNEDGTPRR